MAKNFFKNIFNQTKNTISKKKSINDSQKLSDIIIINNNESNFFQQKPCDKFNILSNYYQKKEKNNKTECNFLERINVLNNKYHITQEKYILTRSSFDKLNDELFSNLLKQIDCYIEEIKRLNKKLVVINNDNKEEIIRKLNKTILKNEKTIRNYKQKLREYNNKEEKLTKEIEYYKKRIIFYKNKININLISRKISNENNENKKRKENNNINSNLKYYDNVSNNLTKPHYNRVKSNYFNQSSGRIIQLRSDKKILSSTEFPNVSNKTSKNIRNKLLTKENQILEKDNQISEFFTEKESKEDFNKNIINTNNKTTSENLNFSNDSSDNINEQNEDDDFDIYENLNINKSINQLCSNSFINKSETFYSKHNKNNSDFRNNNFFKINGKQKYTSISNNIYEYKNKKNVPNINISDSTNELYKKRKSEIIDSNIQSNLNLKYKNINKSYIENKNTKNNLSFKNSINLKASNNINSKSMKRHNTFYRDFNNQNIEKSANVYSNKDKNLYNKNKDIKINENVNESKNKKHKNKSKYKKMKRIETDMNNKENKEKKQDKIKLDIKGIKSENSRKGSSSGDNNKKEECKKDYDEKELKKILKDMNEDYNNDIEMLNNQENQIKFLLNLIDINN